MGKLFKYIRDDALHELQVNTNDDDYECHQCTKKDVPIYTYSGSVIDWSLTPTPEFADKDPSLVEIDELCAECIKGDNIKICDYYLSEITKRAPSASEEAIKTLIKTPQMRNTQWPFWATCCNDFAEFIGSKPLDGTSPDEYTCQCPQDEIVEGCSLSDFYPMEEKPFMWKMRLFQCLKCNKKYWHFQYSGIPWSGPKKVNNQGILGLLKKLVGY